MNQEHYQVILPEDPQSLDQLIEELRDNEFFLVLGVCCLLVGATILNQFPSRVLADMAEQGEYFSDGKAVAAEFTTLFFIYLTSGASLVALKSADNIRSSTRKIDNIRTQYNYTLIEKNDRAN